MCVFVSRRGDSSYKHKFAFCLSHFNLHKRSIVLSVFAFHLTRLKTLDGHVFVSRLFVVINENLSRAKSSKSLRRRDGMIFLLRVSIKLDLSDSFLHFIRLRTVPAFVYLESTSSQSNRNGKEREEKKSVLWTGFSPCQFADGYYCNQHNVSCNSTKLALLRSGDRSSVIVRS